MFTNYSALKVQNTWGISEMHLQPRLQILPAISSPCALFAHCRSRSVPKERRSRAVHQLVKSLHNQVWALPSEAVDLNPIKMVFLPRVG